MGHLSVFDRSEPPNFIFVFLSFPAIYTFLYLNSPEILEFENENLTQEPMRDLIVVSNLYVWRSPLLPIYDDAIHSGE